MCHEDNMELTKADVSDILGIYNRLFVSDNGWLFILIWSDLCVWAAVKCYINVVDFAVHVSDTTELCEILQAYSFMPTVAMDISARWH